MDNFLYQKRNEDFFRMCEELWQNKRFGTSISQIAEIVASGQAPSFYVTERAVRDILSAGRPTSKNHLTARKQADIIEYARKHEGAHDIIQKIMHAKAPSFYLSPVTARDLYYSQLKSNQKRKCEKPYR